jgi:hypothetical protein
MREAAETCVGQYPRMRKLQARVPLVTKNFKGRTSENTTYLLYSDCKIVAFTIWIIT